MGAFPPCLRCAFRKRCSFCSLANTDATKTILFLYPSLPSYNALLSSSLSERGSHEWVPIGNGGWHEASCERARRRVRLVAFAKNHRRALTGSKAPCGRLKWHAGDVKGSQRCSKVLKMVRKASTLCQNLADKRIKGYANSKLSDPTISI